MTDGGWFYTATDIARPLVDGEVPAMKQYAFLDWLRAMERPFLPRQWREGNAGRRALLLDVQNAIAYLVDSESFEADRNAVEKEGGILPDADTSCDSWAFFKALRLEYAFKVFSGKSGTFVKRMKCRTLLRRCGVRRRNAAFCLDFALAAAFYHFNLRRVSERSSTRFIDDFSLDETVLISCD